MKIKLTTVYVEDQDKALRFYTEVLGFVKKADFSNGGSRPYIRRSDSDVGSRGPPTHDENGEEIQTQNISIPADMVGCIIGRAGSKISEIRKSSGARISIAKVCMHFLSP